MSHTPLVIAALPFGLAIAGAAFMAARAKRRETCNFCHFPMYRCECPPKCEHAETTTLRWSQDGWIKICAKCGEWLYLGDDFDNRPE